MLISLWGDRAGGGEYPKLNFKACLYTDKKGLYYLSFALLPVTIIFIFIF
jgi:hypothetical protein